MRQFFILCLLFITACQGAHTTRTIDMYNSSGDMVGTATFAELPDGVEVSLELDGLSPGFHGVNIHEIPKCEGPHFTSAGNHLNPEGKNHGLMHPEGSHLGDLPNIEVDSDGEVDVELQLDDATLLEGKNSILQGEGSSIIITSDEDDGLTQPSGDSGTRIVCGELKAHPDEESTETPTDPTKENGEDEDEMDEL